MNEREWKGRTWSPALLRKPFPTKQSDHACQTCAHQATRAWLRHWRRRLSRDECAVDKLNDRDDPKKPFYGATPLTIKPSMIFVDVLYRTRRLCESGGATYMMTENLRSILHERYS